MSVPYFYISVVVYYENMFDNSIKQQEQNTRCSVCCSYFCSLVIRQIQDIIFRTLDNFSNFLLFMAPY